MASAPTLRPPWLTAYDPPEGGEGGIDPLSLLFPYERLAERVFPWITVRMSRVRFVTAIAAAARACAPLRDRIGADGVTPAWLAFEWHVARALVSRADLLREGEPRRVPGRLKLTGLLQRGQSLSHATYLKTPKIFGLTGIFRRLAHGLLIVTDDLDLDEGGFDLLRAWEDEQGLHGFVSGSAGPGATLREAMRDAVHDALEHGRVARPDRWEHWATLARAFDPAGAGPRESAVLLDRLTRPDMRPNPRDPEAVAMRREMIGRLRERAVPVNDLEQEAAWFRSLLAVASPPLRERLELIVAFEGIATLLEDAFALILQLGTSKGSALGERDYAADPRSGALASRLPAALDALATRVAGTRWEDDVRPTLLAHADGRGDAPSLFRNVLAHHEQSQRRKPPEGKRPWVERVGDGVLVRPQYRRDDGAPGDPARFVHAYRTPTVSAFLQDLGALPR